MSMNHSYAQLTELNNNLIKKGDSLTFRSYRFNNVAEIVLLNNNEFIKIQNDISDYGGKSIFKDYYGKYELLDSILTLKPIKVKLEVYTGIKERTTTKEIIDYKSDSILKIRTVYVIKEHNNSQYLLPIEFGHKDLNLENIPKTTTKRLFQRILKK